MGNPNKARGTQWESAVRNFLNAFLGLVDDDGAFIDPFDGLNVRRPAQEGTRDVGDVHAAPFILECKDVRSPAVPTWLRQARAEATNAGFPYGVVVHKVRGLGIRAGRVHFDVRTWTRTRTALGLSTRDMRARYGFVPSMRGLGSGRWYLTTTVSEFGRLLADIRAVSTRAAR
ncbi:hypothetical protein [Streptomyces sp. NBC_00102]|uniref:hypothetical protein n=1 Tax=Streptomyces sp. NBC_00102 TaxID=2975652 RepID=UPI00224E1BE6|nr:hypothetical protein [Streptomyces sp. NBC_00102]MCX5398480.1 hypothetical protein [Streptomyces sp. NBC_00102]